MKHVQEAMKVLKMYPKLQLGDKTAHGVKSTGPHTVKITAEPTTVAVMKGSKSVKHFKFLVEEKGQLYKWLVPLTNDMGEGHYLLERLANVEIGDELILEMKKRGARNYIEVLRPGEVVAEDEAEVEEEVVDPWADDNK